jgi:SAM domain (Sterile alpha motif)
MDVCEWLKGLRLGQYEATFRAQEIEANVLADLTEGALEEIGLPLAARKRLMRVIADLGSSASSPPRTEPKSDAKPTTALADAAERRNITVMFCDLVGSTGLAAGLDAEDWRSLNQRLSRRGLGGGDRARPPCAEKAWRRADGPFRLSAGAGERRRASGAGGAHDPARAFRPQPSVNCGARTLSQQFLWDRSR